MSFYLDPAYGRMNWQPVAFDGSAAKAFANLLVEAAWKKEPAYTRVDPFSSTPPVIPQPVYTVSGGIQASV